MSSFNVISGGRSQVLVDEQQLRQLKAESDRRGEELQRLQAAMETLSAVNAPAHFVAASMALANELASRWRAERVGIGFLKGRYIRLVALSHTEKITRHMQLVQDIEGAMEECLDQDLEIIFPPPKEASFVYRITETLATRHGPNAVIALPLRRTKPGGKDPITDDRFGNVVAVLCVERKADQPFTLAEIEALRLTCDLFTSRLVDLYENDRWIGAKAARSIRRGLAWVVGAKHTWAKLIAILVAGFIAFATLVNGNFRVDAPFVFETSEKQVLSAPFEGTLKTVRANVGDMVFSAATAAPFNDLASACPLAPVVRVSQPATVLATLDTADIHAHLISAQMEEKVHLQEAQLRASEGKQAETQMARLDAQKSHAEAELYQWQMDQATIKTPVDGVILSGDLRDKLGAPVKTGDDLYEIGQPELLRAELSVSEDQVSELKVGQRGVLKASSYPDRPITFTVERINPIATVSSAKNIFKVRAVFDPGQIQPWMRPGVEGVAKVDISKARYAWIWTHRLINWIRMKLWL